MADDQRLPADSTDATADGDGEVTLRIPGTHEFVNDKETTERLLNALRQLSV